MQTKLKATAEEFENSRKEAKNAKEEFLAVKNERWVGPMYLTGKLTHSFVFY